MQTNELKRNTPLRKKIQRGRGGKRGKTSGRGTKGQKARAGHKIRPEIRDAIRKLPKKRGYRFKSIKVKPVAVSLNTIEKSFTDSEMVNPQVLFDKNIIRKVSGKLPSVKIVSTGAISKKLNFSLCQISAEAKKKIETVGGKIN